MTHDSIIFKNVHFDTHFQRFAFQAPICHCRFNKTQIVTVCTVYTLHSDALPQAQANSRLSSVHKTPCVFPVCYFCISSHVIMWGSPSLKIFLGIRLSACVSSQKTGLNWTAFSFHCPLHGHLKSTREGEIRHVPILSNAVSLFPKSSHVHFTLLFQLSSQGYNRTTGASRVFTSQGEVIVVAERSMVYLR